MDPNELIELLDLNDPRAGPSQEPALSVSETVKSRNEPCRTALEVDAWGERRGEDLLRSCERIHPLKLDPGAVAVALHKARKSLEAVLCPSEE